MIIYSVSANEHRKHPIRCRGILIGCLPSLTYAQQLWDLQKITQFRWDSLPTLATYGNRFHGACLTAHGLGGDNLAVSRVAGRILAKHNACALNMWSGGAGG